MTEHVAATEKRLFDSPAQEAFLALWRTFDRLRLLEDDLFSQYDLTAQQYNTLRLLQAAAPRAVPTLAVASRLISRAPDITRLLDRLEKRGLVRRQRLAKNRRVVEVAITPAGVRLLDELASAVLETHQRQLGHLNKAELTQLTELLRKARAPFEPDDSVWR